MMDASLLSQLSATHFVSGEELARQAGCSRAAIAKRMDLLRAAGVLIEARSRLGYRLSFPYEWWTQQRLDTAFSGLPDAPEAIALAAVASTNDWLRDQLVARQDGRCLLAVTDFQQGGKGRRGRAWLAPVGRQLTFSIGIAAAPGPLAWIGVALAVGAELAQMLNERGWPVQLKWPNDLLLDGRKLAGILVELDAMAEGPSRVVVGVGINEALLPDERSQLDRPVAALQDLPFSYSRAELLAAMAQRLSSLLQTFPERGLGHWLPVWQDFDALRGQTVDFQRGEDWLRGKAQGIDGQGSLLLETAEGLVRCHSGEISVRQVMP